MSTDISCMPSDSNSRFGTPFLSVLSEKVEKEVDDEDDEEAVLVEEEEEEEEEVGDDDDNVVFDC